MAVDVYAPEGAGAPLPVTVVCHGFKGFKDWGLFPPLCERLAASGRALVTFDYSHSGIGDEPGEFTRLDLFEAQTVSRHVADLGLVFDHLDAGSLSSGAPLQKHKHYNVLGHSLGGAVAILRAAEDGRVVQVSTLNAVADLDRLGPEGHAELEAHGRVLIRNQRTGQDMPLGRAWLDDLGDLDLEDAATQVFVPALIVQGDADTSVSPAEAEQINSWIAGSRLARIAGGDHTFGAVHPFAGWTPALEAVAGELDAFLPHVGRLGGI